MEPYDTPPKPTMADEVKLGVDDDQVIAKTLPPVRSRTARIEADARLAMEHARGYVAGRPVQSVLVAAASGAAVTAALLALTRNARI